MSKPRYIKYIADVVTWFDRINGNTHHSVRVTRCRDSKVIVCPFTYGYDSAYEQTTLRAMANAKWIPPAYRRNNGEYLWQYQQERNYPILFTVTHGLKRDCITNGKE